MKATLTVTSRGVVTLPVEIYTAERIAEFAREEAQAAKVMAAHEKKTRRRRRA